MSNITTSARQCGLEIIKMSEMASDTMEVRSDILTQRSNSKSAPFSAGFTTKSSVQSGIEMVVDVQLLGVDSAVIRTWAIELMEDDVSNTARSNKVALTFKADRMRAQDLIDKGRDIVRDDIRVLLQDDATQPKEVRVSKDAVGNKKGIVSGEIFSCTFDEPKQMSDEEVSKIDDLMNSALKKLEESLATHKAT